jgi:sugar phosphate isomerase/epimerase
MQANAILEVKPIDAALRIVPRPVSAPMRVSLAVASYTPLLRTGVMTTEEFLQVAHDLGFRDIEVCDRTVASRSPDYLTWFRSELRRLDLRVVCLDIRNDFTHADPRRRAASIEATVDWIETARTLGARLARVWAGMASADDGATRRVIDSLRQVVPAAAERGVVLALENHGGVTANPDNVVRIVDTVGSPSLGTCPDFGWFAPDDRLSGFRKLVARAVHVHAKTHALDAGGEDPEIDYRALGQVARDVGYRGFLSIEYEGPGADVAARTRGVEQTRELIDQHFLFGTSHARP